MQEYYTRAAGKKQAVRKIAQAVTHSQFRQIRDIAKLRFVFTKTCLNRHFGFIE